MIYIIYFAIAVLSVIFFCFAYMKAKSIQFINSFQLIDSVLYKDKIPYNSTIRVNETGGVRAYFDFNQGYLTRVSLYMKDGATTNWSVGDTYISCYDKEGNSIPQGRFEALYARFVDVNSILEIFNRNFKQCQLAI